MCGTAHIVIGTDIDSCRRRPSVVRCFDVIPINCNRGVKNAVCQIQADFKCASINIALLERKIAEPKAFRVGVEDSAGLVVVNIEGDRQLAAVSARAEIDIDPCLLAGLKMNAFSVFIAHPNVGNCNGLGVASSMWAICDPFK